jgi:hypothetical protein
MILQRTLTVLFDSLVEGLARLGCGLGGLPYLDKENTP